MLVNAFVEMLFMPNCANFSEQIRTGNLDFALVKPIDTQFLVSFQTVDMSLLAQVVVSLGLLAYSVTQSHVTVTLGSTIMYAFLVVVAVGFFYSMMIALASAAVFMGRNQGLYDFWFYVTSFARYPGDLYRQGGLAGEIFWFGFSFVIPILLVVTVPSRMYLNKALTPNSWVIVLVTVITAFTLWGSRKVFQWSLSHYRSASS
jgi:ABC-2 type transport system permease protein